MEMVSLFVLGCIVGLFAGLVPGVGVFTALILLYPLLIDLSIQELLVLYIPIASISQFIGSVPALFFKIPGEATSFIATEYGHNLFHNGHHDLIPLTAIGSFIATILSAGILMLLPIITESWFHGALTTNFVFAMLLITGVCLTATSKNNWLITIILIALGMTLGNVGFNGVTGRFFGTFGNVWLSYGIPLFPFIVAIYVLPNILNLGSSNITFDKIDQAYSSSLKSVKKYFSKMIGGSVIGMFCGFVPVVGKIVGVSASRSVYVSSDKNSVIAAESSNNSSIFTAMIPLFLFGVPITLGEILILNIAETNNFNLAQSFKEILTGSLLPITILASGTVGLILSWPLARYCTYIFKLQITLLKTLLIAIVFGSLIYLGMSNGMLAYYLIILVLLMPLGYALKKVDVIPLIFAFIFAKFSMTIIERVLI
jgi:TctA family transporter